MCYHNAVGYELAEMVGVNVDDVTLRKGLAPNEDGYHTFKRDKRGNVVWKGDHPVYEHHTWESNDQRDVVLWATANPFNDLSGGRVVAIDPQLERRVRAEYAERRAMGVAAA